MTLDYHCPSCGAHVQLVLRLTTPADLSKVEAWCRGRHLKPVEMTLTDSPHTPLKT